MDRMEIVNAIRKLNPRHLWIMADNYNGTETEYDYPGWKVEECVKKYMEMKVPFKKIIVFDGNRDHDIGTQIDQEYYNEVYR